MPPRALAASSVDPGLIKTDADGERVPAPLSGFDWLDTFMRFGLARRPVPAEAVSVRGGVAHVSCVCGATTSAPLAAYPRSCDCSRWFFYDGTTVWVLLSPKVDEQ